jgi:hypothetical protein
MSDKLFDIKVLLQNLRDLDQISDKVFSEFEQKNRILQKGLSNCKLCRVYIDANNNPKWDYYRQTR